MTDGLDHTNLKAKQRALRADFPETMGLRVHRSISWIGRAEAAHDDPDAQFLFLWIGLNAAYADEEEFQTIQPGERASFAGFFNKVVMLRRRPADLQCRLAEFFRPYSPAHEQQICVQSVLAAPGFGDWEDRFEASNAAFHSSFAEPE